MVLVADYMTFDHRQLQMRCHLIQSFHKFFSRKHICEATANIGKTKNESRIVLIWTCNQWQIAPDFAL